MSDPIPRERVERTAEAPVDTLLIVEETVLAMSAQPHAETQVMQGVDRTAMCDAAARMRSEVGLSSWKEKHCGRVQANITAFLLISDTRLNQFGGLLALQSRLPADKAPMSKIAPELEGVALAK